MGKFATCLVLLLLPLSACGTNKDTDWSGDCPTGAVLSEAATLTRFKPGQGKDPTDVVLTGEMQTPKLSCDYDKESGKVEVSVSVPITVKRGPAAGNAPQKLSFFVAIVDTDSNVIVKHNYAREISLDENVFSLSESPDNTVFNVAKDKKPVAYEVLIGFQLSRDELAYNRERHRYMP